MEDKYTVTYEFESGFSRTLEAVDEEQATDIAREIYEQVYDCVYSAAKKNGEVIKEWSW